MMQSQPQPQPQSSSDLRVLIISLEFLGPVFSGNGQYCRSIVRALKGHGARVFVVSGRKAEVPMSEQDEEGRAHASDPRHGAFDIPLNTWQRLDRASGWEELAAGAASDGCLAAVRAFAPQVVLCVDWTGVPAWLNLRARLVESDTTSAASAALSDLQAVYLNFRVFASSFPATSPADKAAVAGTSAAAAAVAGAGGGAAAAPGATPAGTGTGTAAGHPCTAVAAEIAAERASGTAPPSIPALEALSPAQWREALEGLDDRLFYCAVEGTAVRATSRTIALCRQDSLVLTALACGADIACLPSVGGTGTEAVRPLWDERCGAAGAGAAWAQSLLGSSSRGNSNSNGDGGATAVRSPSSVLQIVMPPLRSDIQRLAVAVGAGGAGTGTGGAASNSSGGTSTTASSSSSAAPAFDVGTLPDHTTLTCAVRLSSEKGPHRLGPLLSSLRSLSPGLLSSLSIQPLIVGSGPDKAYVGGVIEGVRAACGLGSSSDGAASSTAAAAASSLTPAPIPPLVHISTFVGPRELAAIYSNTRLNIHPALADAYGMTVVEAAAFGAPTVIHVPGFRGFTGGAGQGNNTGGGEGSGSTSTASASTSAAPQPVPVPPTAVFGPSAALPLPGYLTVNLSPLAAAAAAAAAAAVAAGEAAAGSGALAPPLALASAALGTALSLPPVGCCDLLAPQPSDRHSTGVVPVDLAAPPQTQAAQLLPWLQGLRQDGGAGGEGGNGEESATSWPCTFKLPPGLTLASVGERARARALAWGEGDNGAALLQAIADLVVA